MKKLVFADGKLRFASHEEIAVKEHGCNRSSPDHVDIVKLKTIFTEASAIIVPEERIMYLDAACDGDHDLRKKVESLLASQAKLHDFLEPPQSLKPMDVAEVLGGRVGPYKILQKIGEGGFGVVYMAEREEPIRRMVALKIIKAGMDTKQVLARFEAERQALAIMDHPNIARVFNAGETDKHGPYFVMELVKGIPITEFCDEKGLSTRERLELFLQICSAVQHAHQKGIIHRDIKPSNVMVTMVDGRPVPKVIDFGVAKALAQRLTEKTLFTRYDQLIGTPAYMSPEQAELSGQDVDTRSDIYSLGVLLYELLTGTPPIESETLRKAGIDEIRRLIRETDPPSPSARLQTLGEKLVAVAANRQVEPAILSRTLRGDLDWVVMKCLEKDRNRRYATAGDLSADINRYLKHEPVIASPPSNLYRLQKFVQRNRLQVAFAVSVAAVIIIGLILALIGFADARRERDRALVLERKAQADEQKARTEAARSAEVVKFLGRIFDGVDPAVARGRDTTMMQEILGEMAPHMSEDLSNAPEVEADLRITLGDIYSDIGDYTNSIAMYAASLVLERKLHGEVDPKVANALYKTSDTLWRMGRLSEAESALRESLTVRRKFLAEDDPVLARTLTRFAELLAKEGGAKAAEAQALYPEAEDVSRKAIARQTKELGEGLQVAWSISELGWLIYQEPGKAAESEKVQRQALAMMDRTLPKNHPLKIAALDWLSIALSAQGKYAEAEEASRQAVAICRKIFSPNHPSTAYALEQLGYVLENEHKLPEAEKTFREVVDMRRIMDGKKHFELAMALQSLAGVLQQEGHLDEGESLFREALAMDKDIFGPEHPTVADALGKLGDVLTLKGNFHEAESDYRQALAIREKAAPNDWQTFSLRSQLGSVLLAEKKYSEAGTLLLSGYRGLQARADKLSAGNPWPLKNAIQRLIQFSEATTNFQQAAEWKQKLAALELHQ